MSKFISTMALLLTLVSVVQSQTSTHLTFKGIPIDGTLNEYVANLKKSGFVHEGTSDGTAILIGEFAGYKDCHVGVLSLSQKDLVYSIAVVFPEKDAWSSLSSNYFDIKNMLTEKYGAPTEVVEEFVGRSKPEDDHSKIFEVKFDRCKYKSVWTTDKGDIFLSISNKNLKCYVALGYLDKINSKIMKSNAIDDL